MFTSKPFVDWAARFGPMYRRARDRFFTADKTPKTGLHDDKARAQAKSHEQKRNRSIRDKLSRN